jgi:hypothetical protein
MLRFFLFHESHHRLPKWRKVGKPWNSFIYKVHHDEVLFAPVWDEKTAEARKHSVPAATWQLRIDRTRSSQSPVAPETRAKAH